MPRKMEISGRLYPPGTQMTCGAPFSRPSAPVRDFFATRTSDMWDIDMGIAKHLLEACDHELKSELIGVVEKIYKALREDNTTRHRIDRYVRLSSGWVVHLAERRLI